MEPTDEDLVAELECKMTDTVIPVTAYVGIETVLGFFGNILVIYVFSRRYHVCNFRYFVLCMAFMDFTSCLTTMPGEILTQTHWYTYKWNYICKVKSFFNMFTATGVAFSLLTIAIDRYRKICRPFGWQIKPNVAKMLCAIVYFIALSCSMPVFFFWGIQTSPKVYKNRTVTISKCEIDDSFKDSPHPTNYTTGMSVILSLCMFCMFVLYVFVARKLFQDKRKYYGTETKMETFMNSTYLAGASSDALDSSTKESSDTGLSRANTKNKKKIFTVETDEDNCTTTDDDLDSYEKDKHLNKKKASSSQTKPKRKKRKRSKMKSLDRREMAARVRRKTLIMFVLTIVFILTMVLYVTLLSLIAEDVLKTLNETEKAVYFFFFRFYFINHVINPLIYGIMDPHFRQALMSRFEQSGASSSASRPR